MPRTATRTDLIEAREYLRVSLDTSGRERSNEEQHADNVAAAEADGWHLGTPYRDTGSASRHARTNRDAFDRLVDDLQHGRFGAALLVLWENSRGSRQVGEWVNLIELCERNGVRIAVTTHGPRIYDPSNPRDRRSLLEDAVDSEYESSKLSLRLKRATAANAAAGKPHGVPPFGYTRTHDLRTGKFVGQEIDPTEAPIVVEIFERFAAGESLRGISRDLDARGIRSRVRTNNDGEVIGGGKRLTSEMIRPMLLNVAYAGKRSHVPGRMTRKERATMTPTLVDATWPAIVPMSLFLTVRQRLTDPSRKTTRPGRGVHLLSMIARCDVCGGVLAASYRDEGGRRIYQCHTGGHVRLGADDLDELATAKIIAFLSDPANAERLVADDGDSDELFEARQHLAVVRAELDDLADRVGRGEISATLAARAEPTILTRLHEVERRVDELATPSSIRGLFGPGDDVIARWETAPMSAKREVARELLTPAMIGELRVTRSTRFGTNPSPVADRAIWNTIERGIVAAI
jgi:site-specific DNA recombinase